MLLMERVEQPLNQVAVEREIEQFLDDASPEELETFVREGTESALRASGSGSGSAGCGECGRLIESSGPGRDESATLSCPRLAPDCDVARIHALTMRRTRS